MRAGIQLRNAKRPPSTQSISAVPEISQARDWYLKNMGGNVGETADRVAFGRWIGDHPLPLQLIFEVSPTRRRAPAASSTASASRSTISTPKM